MWIMSKTFGWYNSDYIRHLECPSDFVLATMHDGSVKRVTTAACFEDIRHAIILNHDFVEVD